MDKDSVRIVIITLLALLLILSACSPQVPAQFPGAEAASAAQSADAPAPASPTSQPTSSVASRPPMLPISLQQPFQTVAFQEGPFDFELRLYQDSGFSRNPTMTWMYSDLPGVGTHVSWAYHGPALEGPVVESWGTCPDVSPRATISDLKEGDSSIREGGVLLPKDIAPGWVVQFVYRIEISQGTYGGILSFLLRQGPQGIEPSKVTIYGFDQPLPGAGCIANLQSAFMPQSTSAPAASAAITATPCWPSELRVEEHALENAPQVDPLVFTPVQGSQETVSKEPRQEWIKRFPDNTFVDQGRSAMRADWGSGELIARETRDHATDRMGVDLILAGQRIYSIELGVPSPIKPLQGLWTYSDHWVLEVARVIQQTDPNGGVKSAWVGQIVRDGVSLDDQRGYEEAFGFQLMRGKPFYFFRRERRIGFSYEGQEVLLDYDQIPHYECCSGAELNPVSAENLVAFFAQRDETWYYAEIGAFE